VNQRAIDELQREWADREVHRQTAILESKKDFIADDAWLCWSKGELRFFLCESAMYMEFEKVRRQSPELASRLSDLLSGFGRFNGYVRFPALPVVAPGMHGIIDYVPVHGGITFFQQWWDGSVTYGFDTGHAVSLEHPEILNDLEWMMTETESMARGIQIAARFERFYLNAGDDNKRKARVLGRMGKFLPVEDLSISMMLNLLQGEL
jgi:hypothetical protein